jgi:hypothetical protein
MNVAYPLREVRRGGRAGGAEGGGSFVGPLVVELLDHFVGDGEQR